MWLSIIIQRAIGVQKANARPALWAALCYFFVLCSYYMLRPVRESIGIAGDLDDLKWLFFATMAAMLLATPIFGWLVSRYPRRTFIAIAYRFFMLNMLLFFVASKLTPASSLLYLGYVFYVWLSVFNLFVVSILWALTVDVFTLEGSKRVFGALAAGGSLGAIAGGLFTDRLIGHVDQLTLLLFAIVLLEAGARCAARLGRFAPPAEPCAAPSQRETSRVRPFTAAIEGLTLTLRSPYLLGVVLFFLFFTFTSTVAYFEQAHIVKAAFGDNSAGRIRIFARVDIITNAITLFVQLMLAGRIMLKFGVGSTLALLPLICTIGFAALAVAPTLSTLVAFQVLRRAGNYGLARPARETLFTVISPEAKYKAKTFIDTFVYRSGDLVAAVVYDGLLAIGLSLGAIALVTAPVALAWSALALILGRSQRRIAMQREARTLVQPQAKSSSSGAMSPVIAAATRAGAATDGALAPAAHEHRRMNQGESK